MQTEYIVAMVTNNRDHVFLVSNGKGKVGVECEMCSGGKGSGKNYLQAPIENCGEKKNNLFLN